MISTTSATQPNGLDAVDALNLTRQVDGVRRAPLRFMSCTE
jgi:hypothetical protein